MPEDLASVPLTALAPTAFRAPVTEDLDKFYQRALRRLFYSAGTLRCTATPRLAAHISRRRRHLRSCRFSPKCLRICVMIVEGVSARREALVRARTGRDGAGSRGAGEIAETFTLGPFFRLIPASSRASSEQRGAWLPGPRRRVPVGFSTAYWYRAVPPRGPGTPDRML